jgi:multiple sugar transport system permease protein
MMKKQSWIGIALISPIILLFGILIVYPIVYSFCFSLCAGSIVSPEVVFIGLRNFLFVIQDPDFWDSLRVTFYWTFSVISLQVLISLPISLLLNEPFSGRSFVRSIVIFPYVIPTIVASLIWIWLFNDLYGLINYLLMAVGIISKPIAWLAHPHYAFIATVVVAVWKFFPFVVVCLLARLQTIPDELYEAARIDGASAWQQFIWITLPHLKSILVIVIILRFIWMFNNFDVIYLLTRGGPAGATQTLPIMIYIKAFPSLQTGQGAAIGTMMFIFLVVLSIVYLKFLYKPEEVV